MGNFCCHKIIDGVLENIGAMKHAVEKDMKLCENDFKALLRYGKDG